MSAGPQTDLHTTHTISTPPRILLLGADGQLGWELRRALLPLGDVKPLNRTQADLCNLPALRAVLDQARPHIIVNAAAYTAVDRAESEPELAQRINAAAPGLLAAWAAEHDAMLVHYSTDYVFDGSKPAPYTELDAPKPRSVYGHSKRAGEQAIAQSGCRHLIFRTSWVYAARGGNFAKTMLKLAREREHLRVVADQFGAPTSAELIADVTALALHRVQTDASFATAIGTWSGLYHLTACCSTSWHGYAQFVLQQAAAHGVALRCGAEAVEPIATADYPLPAPRPANSRLDCDRLQAALGLALPHWQIQVRRMLAEVAVQG
ncbi:MAG: dTDP-4-dehydrorhamnose reductase [Betaproteobacteria bacterium]|nr:dTDP-4-dehydrorhamnose reductase [Betaproteobacteria bacterium]MDE2122492.1 dTDP-4-dehydrorhamnose reductase [Betaproteobacteria bacterium]MDE2185910.1 dTDP-4-dehydrorhamnose reductase [Betaproteobacteria bacterium]MDE2323640.1 dTDP-4-dehydrorhamnose reductase [Betaproteobacteria bacterium]